jgi:hypothetical protein
MKTTAVLVPVSHRVGTEGTGKTTGLPVPRLDPPKGGSKGRREPGRARRAKREPEGNRYRFPGTRNQGTGGTKARAARPLAHLRAVPALDALVRGHSQVTGFATKGVER